MISTLIIRAPPPHHHDRNHRLAVALRQQNRPGYTRQYCTGGSGPKLARKETEAVGDGLDPVLVSSEWDEGGRA